MNDKNKESATQKLPPNWISKMSQKRGQLYYFNVVTRKSIWTFPTPDDDQPPIDQPASTPSPRALPDKPTNTSTKQEDSKNSLNSNSVVIKKSKNIAQSRLQSLQQKLLLDQILAESKSKEVKPTPSKSTSLSKPTDSDGKKFKIPRNTAPKKEAQQKSILEIKPLIESNDNVKEPPQKSARLEKRLERCREPVILPKAKRKDETKTEHVDKSKIVKTANEPTKSKSIVENVLSLTKNVFKSIVGKPNLVNDYYKSSVNYVKPKDVPKLTRSSDSNEAQPRQILKAKRSLPAKVTAKTIDNKASATLKLPRIATSVSSPQTSPAAEQIQPRFSLPQITAISSPQSSLSFKPFVSPNQTTFKSPRVATSISSPQTPISIKPSVHQSQITFNSPRVVEYFSSQQAPPVVQQSQTTFKSPQIATSISASPTPRIIKSPDQRSQTTPANNRLLNLRRNLSESNLNISTNNRNSTASLDEYDDSDVDMEDVEHKIAQHYSTSLVDECEDMEWDTIEEETILKEIISVRKDDTSVKATDNNNEPQIPASKKIFKNLIKLEPGDKLGIVVDTNIFLSNLKFISDLIERNDEILGNPTLIVPYVVLQELDKLKIRHDKAICTLASRSIRFINEKFKERNGRIIGQSAIDDKTKLIECDSADDSILNCCLQLKTNPTENIYNKNVVLLSNDINLRNKALCTNVDAYSKSELAYELI